jgi:hypothetical protein
MQTHVWGPIIGTLEKKNDLAKNLNLRYQVVNLVELCGRVVFHCLFCLKNDISGKYVENSGVEMHA